MEPYGMSDAVKIVVFVPESHADAVRTAMGAADAGKIGRYSYCSFSSKGTGRFLAEEGARPAIGTVGSLEEVQEERIEVVCERSRLVSVIAAIKGAHPYEEVALDVYPLIDPIA
jgi:hypothetical protein